MLINLWSDIPYIYTNNRINFLERKKLEEQLPVFLKSNKQDLYVVTWPGNFTSTRIGCQIINIYLWVNKIKEIYYLNKFEFYKQLWYSNIFLFSGNKNKYLHLDTEWKTTEKNVQDLDKKTLLLEPLFDDINTERFGVEYMIPIQEILTKHTNIQWKEAASLSPFYYFKPITSICKKSYKMI